MTDKRKLVTYILLIAGAIAFLIYGILLGDPLDILIETSGL